MEISQILANKFTCQKSEEVYQVFDESDNMVAEIVITPDSCDILSNFDKTPEHITEMAEYLDIMVCEANEWERMP